MCAMQVERRAGVRPARPRAASVAHGTALVLGDLDLGYPLREAGIPVTFMRPKDDPSRFSNRGVGWIEQPAPGGLGAGMLAAAHSLPGPTVLFVQEDHALQLISRNRASLRPKLSYLLPEADVVDALLDKGRFQELASERGLPVPPGQIVATAGDVPAATELELPVLVKPLVWQMERLHADFGAGKAVVASTPTELRAILDRVARTYERVLVQRFIPGDETGVESYHVYVDPDGRIAAEFTGRKIRTSPPEFGYSTAVETTEEQDVADLGRRVVRAFDVRGVAKVDLKRDREGRLWLFEVNARFNLWHRLGAAAGCNIPALVFADLTGRTRPEFTHARPGVTWSRQPRDLIIAREQGIGLADYVRWWRGVDAVSGLRLSDPMPFLRGSLWLQARDRLERIRRDRRTR